MDFCNIHEYDVGTVAIQWQKEDYHNRALLLVTNENANIFPHAYVGYSFTRNHDALKDMLDYLFERHPYVEKVAREIIREHDEMETKVDRNDTTGTI